MVAQSFSKNFGLYGERIGALHVVCESPETQSRVLGLLGQISRSELTTCPINGARIVATILSDRSLREQWLLDLVHMSDRMKTMRKRFVEGLESRQTPGAWQHMLSDVNTKHLFRFSSIPLVR